MINNYGFCIPSMDNDQNNDLLSIKIFTYNKISQQSKTNNQNSLKQSYWLKISQLHAVSRAQQREPSTRGYCPVHNAVNVQVRQGSHYIVGHSSFSVRSHTLV